MPKKILKKPEEDEYTTIKVPNDLIQEVTRTLIGLAYWIVKPAFKRKR